MKKKPFSINDIMILESRDIMQADALSQIKGGVSCAPKDCSCGNGNTNKGGGDCTCGGANNNSASSLSFD